MKARRWPKLALGLLVAALLALIGAHTAIVAAARLEPPEIRVPAGEVERPDAAERRVSGASARREGGLWLVRLSGSPDEIGWTHSRLLRDEMVENEGVLLGELERSVRLPARWLLLDLAQLRYRNVDQGMSAERRREIAATAKGFAPDPYERVFPTYQRFVYLNALYDIALSFEESPLIGCTTFTFREGTAQGGHTLLARAFDFEVNDIFDEQKAVFFVRESGAIPFASVAWPGLVGVVSGMNRSGLAVVVHGGRAGEPRQVGEPVVHALRRVLSHAHDVSGAIELLSASEPMVSHIVVLADAKGETAALERVPGRPAHTRRLEARDVVTNHFHGPAADDPKNVAVRQKTSTLDREARGRELLAALPGPVGVTGAVSLLRDRRGRGGAELPLGDRRAIDALIATHGVVFDTTAKRLYVSESPHLLGRFVGFDLERELGDEAAPPDGRPTVPPDPLLASPDWKHRSR